MMNKSYGQCCRYTYDVIKKRNIKECLQLNPWMFNQSFAFFTYHNHASLPPIDIFEKDKNWLTENMVIFSGANNDLDEYLNLINWDAFGTWYIHLFPAEFKMEHTMVIGTSNLLRPQKGEDLLDYQKLNKEWEFIHNINPDMFITKHKQGILIGSLNELNLWCIE